MGRAVARRVVKKALVYGSKDLLHVENPMVNLALDLAGVAWEASEAADTRCWGLLPDTIQVSRVELPVGVHQLQLAPAKRSQAVGNARAVQVHVADGRNSFVFANFPSRQLAGKILVR